MQPAQHYPEPTVGALIFDPAGRLFLMKPHKCAPTNGPASTSYPVATSSWASRC